MESRRRARSIWKQMSIHRFWQLMMQDAIDAYYSHPWAWDEIGFGGQHIRVRTRALNAASRSLGRWKSSATTGCAPRYAVSDVTEVTHSILPHGASRSRTANQMRIIERATPRIVRAPTRAARTCWARCKHSCSDAPVPKAEEVDYRHRRLGSAGGVLLQRLARAGSTSSAGGWPFWDTERDWVSDEAGSHELYWEEPRVTGGSDPLAWAPTTAAKASAAAPCTGLHSRRGFHPSDFEVYTRDGVGVDWPIDYEDIRPYYEQLELEMPVAGPAYYPWGHPHGYPYGPHPMGGVGNALIRGCTAAEHTCVYRRARSRFSPVRMAIGHTAFIAGSASRAAKSAPRPARSSRMFPMRSTAERRFATIPWLRASSSAENGA